MIDPWFPLFFSDDARIVSTIRDISVSRVEQAFDWSVTTNR